MPLAPSSVLIDQVHGPDPLRGITLAVRPGERVALVGAPASGHRQLLRLIQGLEAPLRGQVWVADQAVQVLDRAGLRQIRQGLGRLASRPDLLHNLSVYDNVAFPLQLLPDYRPAQVHHHVMEVLNQLGLDSVAQALPDTLDPLQQRLVALARALAPSPGLLLADEPVAGLDSGAARHLLQALGDAQRAIGFTLIVATSLPEVAQPLCDRVVVLDRGRMMIDLLPRPWLDSSAPPLAARPLDLGPDADEEIQRPGMEILRAHVRARGVARPPLRGVGYEPAAARR